MTWLQFQDKRPIAAGEFAEWCAHHGGGVLLYHWIFIDRGQEGGTSAEADGREVLYFPLDNRWQEE